MEAIRLLAEASDLALSCVQAALNRAGDDIFQPDAMDTFIGTPSVGYEWCLAYSASIVGSCHA